MIIVLGYMGLTVFLAYFVSYSAQPHTRQAASGPGLHRSHYSAIPCNNSVATKAGLIVKFFVIVINTH